MPTEYMGGLMAAIQSFLLSCCSFAAKMGPSAVDAPHAGSAALHGVLQLAET